MRRLSRTIRRKPRREADGVNPAGPAPGPAADVRVSPTLPAETAAAVRLLSTLQATAGNAAVGRLVAAAQRTPADAPAKPKKAAAPVAVRVAGPQAIPFALPETQVGGLLARVSGKLGVAGSATFEGAELPAKNRAAWAAEQVRGLTAESLAGARATATNTLLEATLAGETLALELSDAADPTQTFGLATKLWAAGRSLNLGAGTPSAKLARARVALDLEASLAPAAPSKSPAPASLEVGEHYLKRVEFAGSHARLDTGPKKRQRPAVTVIGEGSRQAIETGDGFPAAIKDHKGLQTVEQRRNFLLGMRVFFGSDKATLDHFAAIREVAGLKGTTTFLHEEAASRLLAVQAEIGKDKMPSSDGNGWSFRHTFEAGFVQTIGNLHTLGFAIDYNAAQMPHLGQRGETVDPRSMDLISLVSKRSAQMDLSIDTGDPKKNKAFDPLAAIRGIGDATMSGDAKRQAEHLARPEVALFLAKVSSEVKALSAASEGFRGSLGEKNKERFLALKKEYLAATTPDARQAVMDQMEDVLAPWLKEVDAARDAVAAKLTQAGIAAADTTEADLEGQSKGATSLAAKLARQLKAREGKKPPTGKQAEALRAVLDEARPALGQQGPLAADADLVAELARLAVLAAERAKVLGPVPAQKRWWDRMVALRKGLTSDPSLLFPRLEKGKEKLEVGLPPMTQLIEHGFFTLKEHSTRGAAFGEDFFVSMVKHGFYPGAAYSHPDSMHFELRWQGAR
jgi:hypothetical protein